VEKGLSKNLGKSRFLRSFLTYRQKNVIIEAGG
jgi:hypothetical protein